MKKKWGIFLTVVVFLSSMLSGCRVEMVATYDAVILGSGVSGLVTAIDLAKNNLRVLIVEEDGIIGGNKRLLSGGVSFLNLEAADTPEQFMEDIENNNAGNSTFFMDTVVEQSTEIPAWLQEEEVDLTEIILMPGQSVARTLMSANGVHSGKELVSKLEVALKKLDVEMEYNSSIDKVIKNNDGTFNLTIDRRTTAVNVNAKTIILSEDAPSIFTSIVTIKSVNELANFERETKISNTNGMELLAELKGEYQTSGEPSLIDTYNVASATQISPTLRAYGGMLVNNAGKRFTNEMLGTTDIAKAIIEQPENEAYLIYDATINEQLKFLEEYYNSDMVIKANTIVELSQKLAIDEATLRSTLFKYKDMVSSQTDDDFSRNFIADSKAFSEVGTAQSTYYAVKVQPVFTLVPTYAVVTNRFEVMEKSSSLPGVYAIGDSAFGVRPKSLLHGAEITTHIVMGQYVAQEVENYLEKIK